MKAIVCGVDGSEHGQAALDFAADEAALRRSKLIVVCAWEIPLMIAPVGVVYPTEVLGDLGENAKKIVQAAVSRVAERQPGVECEGKAIEGQAAGVILEEAKPANMIVVGSRGHGGFASLLLGSVTQQVVHHALCPVVVVR
jgi:nucleotide-binding universal stress UspA family protein